MAEPWGETIWWQLYPLGFLGAEPAALAPGAAPVPRLRGLVPWLDHAAELGCTGLALGPVFASSTHGYDTVDHHRVDARLGTEDDLDLVVREAHARGLHVLLDGVFNHVGADHPYFRDVVERGPASPWAGWFRTSWDDPADPATLHYRSFEGHDHLPGLNHRSPGVLDFLAGVAGHWLDRGVDGWRLDAAYAVPTDAWRQVTDRIRDRHPAAWLVGEVIHGDYAAVVTGGGLDSVTQYELWKATWSALNDRNMWELAWALDRHDGFLDTFVPWTFVGNHDVTRIATRLEHPGHLALALVMLFTIGGSPCIYAGDEVAMEGVKEDRAGGDDAVRPAFPASPADLPGIGGPVHALHRDLVALRRRHPWLTRAHSTRSALTNPTLAYETAGAGGRLAVALNAGTDPQRVALPAGRWHVTLGAADLAGGHAVVPGPGWAVLEAG